MFNNEEYSVYFDADQEKSFWDTLIQVKNATSVLEGSLAELHVGIVDVTDPESIRKAETNTRMKIAIAGKEYPLYEMAIPSLKRRALNEGAILRKMTEEDFCKAINMSWPYFGKEKYKALFRGCGIQALMSGRYVPFHQWNVYHAFVEKVKDRYPYGDVTFVEGMYTHTLTQAMYSIDDDDMLEEIKKKLHEVKFPNADAIKVIVNLITSDTGESSVSVSMSVELGGKEKLQFQRPLHVDHRDNKTFEDVVNNFDKVFALVDKGLGNLIRLSDVVITYPTSVAANIVADKTFKIPKALMDEIMPQFVMYEQLGQTISGFDFFRIVGRIVKTDRFAGYNSKTKLQVEDAIARIAWIGEKKLASFDTKGAAIY